MPGVSTRRITARSPVAVARANRREDPIPRSGSGLTTTRASGHTHPVANDSHDFVATAGSQHPNGPVDEPLAADVQIRLGLPHSATRTGRQDQAADVGHPG